MLRISGVGAEKASNAEIATVRLTSADNGNRTEHNKADQVVYQP
jgi:hypothetical protein